MFQQQVAQPIDNLQTLRVCMCVYVISKLCMWHTHINVCVRARVCMCVCV